MNVLLHHIHVVSCVLTMQEVLSVLVILDIHWMMMGEIVMVCTLQMYTHIVHT